MEIYKQSKFPGMLAALKLALVHWEKKPKVKLSIIVVMWIIALLRFFPWFPALVPFIIIFYPVGFAEYVRMTDYYVSAQSISIILGWLTYLSITALILLFRNKFIIRFLFILMAVILIFNTHGCTMLGEHIN